MCKVDGLLLGYFCCLLHYTTSIRDVGISVHPQIMPGSIPKGFGVNLELLCSIKVHWQWAIRRPHRSPSSMLTIEPRMLRSIEHVGQLLLKTCCQIKLNNRVRRIHLSEIFYQSVWLHFAAISEVKSLASPLIVSCNMLPSLSLSHIHEMLFEINCFWMWGFPFCDLSFEMFGGPCHFPLTLKILE